MKHMKILCLGIAIALSTMPIANCSWTTSDDEQPTYIKASLSEGKNNFKAKNYATAYRQLLPLAVKGNKEAEYAIGYMYYYGKGIDRNELLAENWLTKAAKQGDTRASATLKELSQHKKQPIQEKKEAEPLADSEDE